MARASGPTTTGAALVLGGGVAGIQCSLDLAEGGYKVYLAEKAPALGGHMAQLDKTFPTNDCAMCTMSPKLVEIGRHKDVEIITLADIKGIEGGPGNFTVAVKQAPRYVDEDKCTGCGICTTNCPTHTHVQPLPIVEPLLEDEIKEQVDGILAKNQDRAGALMPILQEINATYNYFPANVLEYVSLRTGRSLADIYHIATFYGSFSITPRGKHTVSVCMGTTCYVRGSQQLMDKVSDVLEVEPDQTTSDKLFTLEPVRCIGCCGLAPAVMIDDKVYGKLTARQVPAILKSYREAS